jgi:hypothetical protein
MTVEQHRHHLLTVDQDCLGCIEFPVGQRENTTYIEQLIKTHFQ